MNITTIVPTTIGTPLTNEGLVINIVENINVSKNASVARIVPIGFDLLTSIPNIFFESLYSANESNFSLSSDEPVVDTI